MAGNLRIGGQRLALTAGQLKALFNNLNGHYTFRESGQVIDLDAIVAGLDLA